MDMQWGFGGQAVDLCMNMRIDMRVDVQQACIGRAVGIRETLARRARRAIDRLLI